MVVVSATIGCATPYQSMGFRGGYAESMAGPGQYVVRAKVNGFTSQGTAMAYAYQRSAELCPGGFDVIDGAQSMNTTYVARTFANGGTVTTVSKPEVTLVVRCR